MADQWEHMSVRAIYQDSRTVELWTVSGPEYRRSERDVEDQIGDQGLALLDKLGQQGWELVSTEQAPAGSSVLRTFWLKRPAEGAGSGWGYAP
jgi:hypothetical protein